MESGQPVVPSVGGRGDVMASSSGDEDANETCDADEPLYVFRIRHLARKCSDSGFKSAVDWLRNCLSRTADDRNEDDDCLPVPIVPLTDEVEDAMDSQVFQKLLKSCGVKPPASEQERFWRIPGSLTSADLCGRTSALADRPFDQNVLLNGGNQQRARVLQELVQKGNKALPGDQEEPTEDDRPNNENSVGEDRMDRGSDRKSRSIKRLLVTLSDSSSDEERLMIDESGRSELGSASKRQRQTSGDAVVLPVADVTGDRVTEQLSHRVDLINALHTFPATAMTQPMSDSDLDDDDDDDDDDVPLVNRKKKATILSDSEDSE